MTTSPVSDKPLSILQQQTVALAGVAQAAKLVDDISKTGSCSSEFLQSSIQSLFQFDANTVIDVFGGQAGVRLGLTNLAGLLANRQSAENRDVVRYLFGLLYLERKFAANDHMISTVHSRLEHANFRAAHFSASMGDTCHSISGIYQDTLSKLKFRITVNGSAEHLKDSKNADMIRSLLLAGIRSAFLWRQLGGHRWSLLIKRKHYLEASRTLSRDLGLV